MVLNNTHTTNNTRSVSAGITAYERSHIQAADENINIHQTAHAIKETLKPRLPLGTRPVLSSLGNTSLNTKTSAIPSLLGLKSTHSSNDLASCTRKEAPTQMGISAAVPNRRLLAPVAPSRLTKPQIYRDPIAAASRPVAAVHQPRAIRPLRLLRTSSASNVIPISITQPTKKLVKTGSVVNIKAEASVLQQQQQIAGRKRRAEEQPVVAKEPPVKMTRSTTLTRVVTSVKPEELANRKRMICMEDDTEHDIVVKRAKYPRKQAPQEVITSIHNISSRAIREASVADLSKYGVEFFTKPPSSRAAEASRSDTSGSQDTVVDDESDHGLPRRIPISIPLSLVEGHPHPFVNDDSGRGLPPRFPAPMASRAFSASLHTRTAINAGPSRQFKRSDTASTAVAPAKDTNGGKSMSMAKNGEEKAVVRDWDDLDADDIDDPMMASEYVNEIIDYMRELEDKTKADPEYILNQREITWDMRRLLIDWMIMTHWQLRMLPETLYLAINILDRFMSKEEVQTSSFQLIGVTSLMIACKYEESSSPTIKDFIFLAGGSYTAKEVKQAELYVLEVIDFDLSFPNHMTFLRRISKAEQYSNKTRTIAKYLMEITLLDHRHIKYSPSMVAASAICVARRIVHAGRWNANMRHFSGYTKNELKPCCKLMLEFIMFPPEDVQFVIEKYMSEYFLRASYHCRKWVYRHQHELLRDPPTLSHALHAPSPIYGEFETNYDDAQPPAMRHRGSGSTSTTAVE